MRARLDEMAEDCRARNRALGAFTCYDMATAQGVIRAAAELSEPIVLLVSPSTAGQDYGLELVSALRLLADKAPVPVSVQLDHARDADLISQTVEAGADAVLVDGSHLNTEANVRFVNAVRRALGPEIVLEAELGRINGDEDSSSLAPSSRTGLTDPRVVESFVDSTGIKLLAVSIGNIHGKYLEEPRIELELLREIAEISSIPLVLHGASGLSSPLIHACIAGGISKININTELRQGLLDYLSSASPEARQDGLRVDRLMAGWIGTVADQASSILESLRTQVAGTSKR